jgi:outer membrane protein OmpA-like peptidoglycan-associated protein
MTKAAPVHPLELISARIDGEITPGETRFLEAHLRSCSACQGREAELRAIASGLAASPVPSPPAEAFERLLARLRRQESAPLASVTVLPVAETIDAAELSRPVTIFRRVAAGVAAATIVTMTVFVVLQGSPPVDERMLESEPRAFQPSALSAPPPPTPAPAAEILMTAGDPVPDAPPPAPTPRPAVQRVTVVAPPVRIEAPEATPVAQPIVTEAPAQDRAEPPAAVRDEPPVALASIPFEGNSKRLTREAKQQIEAAARLLQQRDDATLLVRGHATGKRSIEKNDALGHKRALAVAHHLEELGIDPGRIRTVDAGGGSDRVVLSLSSSP